MSRPPSSRARRLLLGGCAAVAGAGLALVGAGLAGGAPPPSPRPSQAVERHQPAATAGPVTTPAPAGTPTSAAALETPPPDPLPASPPVRVSIPALSIDAGLVDLGVDASGAMQVPTDGASIGWYDRSPTPGQNGPTVLAAHVSWNARPAVFFDLATVQVGQPVTLTRADGAAVTYRVTGVDSYPKDRFPTLQVYGNTTTPQLRLITCGGTFDAAAGHHRDNVVVYAAMDHTAPAPG